MHRFEIEVRKRGKICILDIAGELKLGDATLQLRQASKDLLETGERHLILDMLDVPWLDSSGLGEVFAAFKRARAREGVVKLVLKGKSLSLFTFTQLDKVFEIYDNLEDAIASFAS